MNPHSPACPAHARHDAPDYDAEECAGGECAAAMEAVRASARWAPVDVRARAPRRTARKADAA